MKKTIFAILAGGVLGAAAAAGVARAQTTSPVVVELFTSQGCSSCPPADALLPKIDARKGVIALALHVDYWDYIGWKDTFADPSFTARQKAYARAAGRRMVYTPQMIIGGVADVVGNRPMEVVDQIDAVRAQASDVRLSAERNGQNVSIRAVADAARDMDVYLVRYNPRSVVEIKSGENAGKTIAYNNTVTRWDRIATWRGDKPLALQAKAPGDAPMVVIVQEKGPGRILAATRLR